MTELAIPHPQAALVTEDGKIDKVWYDRLSALFTQYRQTNRDLASIGGGLATKVGVGQKPWSESFIIEFPDDGSYVFPDVIVANTKITDVVTECDAGTCTLTTKINSTALGGTANAVSTSRDTKSHTTANDAVDGDDLVFTVSSNSSCERMSVTVRGTQALA